MGKGDLWDDSALINAFDNAVSTYKVPSLFSLFFSDQNSVVLIIEFRFCFQKMHRNDKTKNKDCSAEESDDVVGENGSNVE